MIITNDNLKLLYTPQQISKRVLEVAAQIKKDLSGNEPLIAVCVLRGAVLFFSDIVKALNDVNLIFDFVTLSSYENAMYSDGKIKLIQDLRSDVSGKDVLVVEDIIDSGHTVNYLRKYFSGKGANSVKIVALLDKPMRRQVPEKADYVAFTLPSDAFIVGYGLDFNQQFRNLNGIYEVLPHG